MKRIINSLNLTGRLMRAFEVDFIWLQLGEWISLVEQWPYRMAWIIDKCDSEPELPDNTLLKEVYSEIRAKIPKLRTEDPLVEIDRNAQNFDVYLRASISGERQLTIGHLRAFVPCTSNLDPYIQKLVRERRSDSQDLSHEGSPTASAPTVPVGGHLPEIFADSSVWQTIETPLARLSASEVVRLLNHLDISPDRLAVYESRIRASNLSGLVLSLCHLDAVKLELDMNLGDWTLFKLLVETLRDNTFPLAPPRAAVGAAEPLLVETERAEANVESTSKASRRKSSVQVEAEAHKSWLMENFGRMDTVEFAGDMELYNHSDSGSRPASVRFDSTPTSHPSDDIASELAERLRAESKADEEEEEGEEGDGLASSGDSTASNAGSDDRAKAAAALDDAEAAAGGGSEVDLRSLRQPLPARSRRTKTMSLRNPILRSPASFKSPKFLRHFQKSERIPLSETSTELLSAAQPTATVDMEETSISSAEEQLTIQKRPPLTDGATDDKAPLFQLFENV